MKLEIAMVNLACPQMWITGNIGVFFSSSSFFSFFRGGGGALIYTSAIARVMYAQASTQMPIYFGNQPTGTKSSFSKIKKEIDMKMIWKLADSCYTHQCHVVLGTSRPYITWYGGLSRLHSWFVYRQAVYGKVNICLMFLPNNYANLSVSVWIFFHSTRMEKQSRCGISERIN